jgi:hypothetical protein
LIAEHQPRGAGSNDENVCIHKSLQSKVCFA